MITRVHRIPATSWPSGWEDVEVVDSELVQDPPAPESSGPAGGAYTPLARVRETRRYGRLVSVLA